MCIFFISYRTFQPQSVDPVNIAVVNSEGTVVQLENCRVCHAVQLETPEGIDVLGTDVIAKG